MDYPLLIVVATGMMKMATGDDLPLKQCAGIGSRLVFVDTEACGSGTSDLGLPRRVLEYLGVYRAKKGCRRPPRWAQPTWALLGAQACSAGWCSHGAPPRCFSGPLGVFWSIKKSTKSFTVFGLRLILISSCKKQAKTTTGTGSIG